MTFLTTYQLTDKARRLVMDSQALHRTIKHAEPGATLWALPTRRTLIVQAPRPVGAHEIGPIALSSSSVQRRTNYDAGTRIEIAGIVNPTRAVRRPGAHSRREPLPPDEWAAWAIRHLAPLRIDTIDTEHVGMRSGQRHEMRVSHLHVAVRATGTVRDEDALAHILINGIGRARAYGCGLLITREIT